MQSIAGELELRRRSVGIPFLAYEPRPTDMRWFLECMAAVSDSTHLVVDDRSLSFSDVLGLAHQRAEALRSLGVVAGDRVLLVGHNSLAWIVDLWGLVELGAVPVLGNAWWSDAELAQVVDEVDAVALLRGDDAAPQVLDASQRRLSPAAHAEDDDAVILFTSGSTGAPRGAVLSHRALIAQQMGASAASPRGARPRDAGPTLLSAPLFHIGGLQALLRATATGATLVISTGRFDPAGIVALIERHRVARWGAVPTMVSRVIDAPNLAESDVRSLQRLVLGGAPVPEGLWGAARRAFPSLVHGAASMYGLSEAGGMVAYGRPVDLDAHPGTAGRLLPFCEAEVREPGPDGVGEIVVRTPTQMTRYWGDAPGGPDAGGWLRTGDLGLLDDDLLFIVGRAKDVIIRGGENVASANVEAALLDHPDVREVAVVGVPDPDLGEVVGAVVAAAGAVDAAELAAHVRGRLAYFEVPTEWWVTGDPLPTTASGKVDRPRLARELLERSTRTGRRRRDGDTA